MPQVLMVGFGQAERERMLRVATQRMNCDFVRAASEQEVTAQIDANLWATALIWWKDIPTGGQLKLIQLLRDRRIPSIVVSDRDLAPEVKVIALEGGRSTVWISRHGPTDCVCCWICLSVVAPRSNHILRT